MARDVGKYSGFPGELRWAHEDRMVSVNVNTSEELFGEPGKWEVTIAEHETHAGLIGRPNGTGSVMIEHSAPRFDTRDEAVEWAKQWMRDNPLPVDKDNPKSVTHTGGSNRSLGIMGM